MKTMLIKISIILLIFGQIFSAKALTTNVNQLYLTNYSFKLVPKSTLISTLVVNSLNQFTVKLSGENAKLFELRKSELHLSPKGVVFFSTNNRVSLSIQVFEANKLKIEKSFILLKDEFATNGVVSHRGAWKNTNSPQNSIASLQNALKLGCEGSEFDVHLTADEVLVINHDAEFNGLKIENTNYDDLHKSTLKNGEPIPTFENFVKTAILQQKTYLVCELKNSMISKERSLLLAEKIASKVTEMKAQAWMIFISFNYDILKKMVELEPSFKTMYLENDGNMANIKKDRIWGLDFHYSVYQENSEWISEAHKLGMAINAWTVNDTLTADFLIARNIDFITTDEPEMMLQRMKKRAQRQTESLIWSDEFNYSGLPDSSKWSYDVGGKGWGNNELQYYTKADTQNVWVKDGHLIITARKLAKDKNEYTSARLVTKNKGDWRYGRIEIRAKLPKGRGLWPAIWMLSTDWKYGGWPASGEIDIMEHVGYNPDSVFVTVHTKSFNHLIGTQVSKGTTLPQIYSDYHVYSINWTAEKMDFLIDEKIYLSFKNSHKNFDEWPFDQPFHLLLNIAVGGGWGGKMGVDNAVFPASMEVDYVRVYQQK